MKQTTLCLLLGADKILLALKKRGFGSGKWNGTGGKFNPEIDKSIVDAAIRETEEEIGVLAQNPERVGVLRFKFPYKPEWDQDVHLFLVKEWQGNPEESEEMIPKWFTFSEIPYKDMWPDDIHWMPHILRGEKVKANFLFGEGDKILDYNVKVVDKI